MTEERYHTTTKNRLYPDMSNVNKNITVEAKRISPPKYISISVRSEFRVDSGCSLKGRRFLGSLRK